MSKQLVEFELVDGSKVVFETDQVDTPRGDQPVGIHDRVRRAAEKFDDVVKRIVPAAQVLMSALREFEAPQEIELEFGLKIGGKSGVVFASVDGEVNFNVKLKWNRGNGA